MVPQAAPTHPPIIVYSTSCPSRHWLASVSSSSSHLSLSQLLLKFNASHFLLISRKPFPLSPTYLFPSSKKERREEEEAAASAALICRNPKKMDDFSSLSLSIFSVFISIMTAQAVLESDATSIYEALQSHGLPKGLLPKGVTDFSIDESGRFEAHLERPCTAKFENEVRYDRNVSGTLSYGKMAALSGITAQELFLWFPVKGIRVDIPSSGLIYFDVGVIYKQFSLSLFETPPDCRASDPALSKSKSGELCHKLDQEERAAI